MGEPVPVSRQRQVLVAMTLANAMILVDQTAVPLALPDVMQTFGAMLETCGWADASVVPALSSGEDVPSR